MCCPILKDLFVYSLVLEDFYRPPIWDVHPGPPYGNLLFVLFQTCDQRLLLICFVRPAVRTMHGDSLPQSRSHVYCILTFFQLGRKYCTRCTYPSAQFAEVLLGNPPRSTALEFDRYAGRGRRGQGENVEFISQTKF